MERNIMMEIVNLKRNNEKITGQVLYEGNIVQRAIFHQLCKILDAGKPAFTPRKRERSIVMFVGLKGSGKTTTCTKYARYHRKRGYSPALVCADTSKAGAFDQLKQNAMRARIPFYGSYTESDPVKIAVEGIERFRNDNCDLIIVDTSGRHEQGAARFEEMRQLVEATKPHLVIFVMDSRRGQAALDQATVFQQNVAVGAVILTKLDGHTKGGGALSAVASTKSPIIFVGTGKHMNEFEVFDVKPFVSRLIGTGEWSGLMDTIDEAVPEDQQPQLVGKLSRDKFTFRCVYEILESNLQMGSLFQKAIFNIPPSHAGSMSQGHLSLVKIKRYMTIMNSMTNKELEEPVRKRMKEAQMMRIARGSGQDMREVMEMMRLANGWRKVKERQMFPTIRNKTDFSNMMNLQNQLMEHMSVDLPQMLTHLRELVGTTMGMSLPWAP